MKIDAQKLDRAEFRDTVRFDAQGLVTAVVQDAETLEVLMVAWMNREALDRTIESGQAVFWSRSRREIWHKGATSGNFIDVEGDPGRLRWGHPDPDGQAAWAGLPHGCQNMLL